MEKRGALAAAKKAAANCEQMKPFVRTSMQ
jgi:hypothetical protein